MLRIRCFLPLIIEKTGLPKTTTMKPIEEAMEDDVFEADSPTKTDPTPSTSHEEVWPVVMSYWYHTPPQPEQGAQQERICQIAHPLRPSWVKVHNAEEGHYTGSHFFSVMMSVSSCSFRTRLWLCGETHTIILLVYTFIQSCIVSRELCWGTLSVMCCICVCVCVYFLPNLWVLFRALLCQLLCMMDLRWQLNMTWMWSEYHVDPPHALNIQLGVKKLDYCRHAQFQQFKVKVNLLYRFIIKWTF